MTQPPPGPPGPPWGGYPPTGSPPPKRGRGWEIFGGVVVGGISAILVPLILIAIAAGSSSSGAVEVIVGLVLVPLIGIGLLFGKAPRPWGIGILIGWAIAVIVVGGACVAIIASLGNV